MAIKKYIQGYNDTELFSILGSLLVDQDVHKELGTAITSKNNDIWYVQTNAEGFVSFALLRSMKSTNAIHLRFIYGLQLTPLIKKIVNDCKRKKLKSIWTNARDTDKLWYKNGFINKKGTNSTGKFVRFEKDLKND